MDISLNYRFGDPEETQWFDIDDKREALIARWDNSKYQIGIQRFRTIYQEKRARLLEKAQKESGTLAFDELLAEVEDDEQSELQVQTRLMARYILLDIRTKGRADGKLEIDDKAVKYDPSIGETLLQRNTDLFIWVTEKAQELRDGAYSLADSAKKKPSPTSSGKARGAKATAGQQKKSTQR